MLHYAQKCKRSDFNLSPKSTWDIFFEICKVYQGHHKRKAPKHFQDKEGSVGTSDGHNADIIAEYFTNIFNQEVQVDENEINKIPQRPTDDSLGTTPTYDEINKTIAKMASEKAPGTSGTTTDMLKNLPQDAKRLLAELIQQYWEQPNCNFETWHTNILSLIYKGKGNTKDPKNWRPVCLKETTAKIVSAIVASRLLSHIEKIGTPNQFGHIGCQEALHTIRNILITRRLHGKETYVLFVDLVKAFDTVIHQALFTILTKYGIPQNLITVIKKMYHTVKLSFTKGKEKRFIDYTKGVFQGDNASPVLFLYIMLAATDTFKNNHTHHNAPIYNYFPDDKNPSKQHGRLVRQPTTSKGTTLSVDHILYVDDGAFISTTREGIESITQALYTHLAKFGLKMHVGKNNEESKTLAMLIPPSLEQSKENIKNHFLPPKILINNGQNYIPFTNEFKYLGSIIHITLQEDEEIKKRIKQAWSTIGIMKHFLKKQRYRPPIKSTTIHDRTAQRSIMGM